jgi:hypothetical protein
MNAKDVISMFEGKAIEGLRFQAITRPDGVKQYSASFSVNGVAIEISATADNEDFLIEIDGEQITGKTLENLSEQEKKSPCQPGETDRGGTKM